MSQSSDHLDEVQDVVGYRFALVELLETALTHSSYAAENEAESYERLEFLGDAVLELAMTARLYELLSDAPEGRMTRIRAAIVDEKTLSDVARDVGLARAIRLGVGEDRSGGRDRPSILSDVIEAIIGAVYIDGGAEAAFEVVYRLFGEAIDDRVAARRVADSRSSLQEDLARTGRVVSFEYERSGPDHAVVFRATAYVDGGVIGTGSGSSKKAAAIAAAQHALDMGIS